MAFDSPIRPVRPVRAVRRVGPITVRRRPGIGQLASWLAFARRVARRSPAAVPPADEAPRHHPAEGHAVDIEA